jgi:hypothetical protein
VMNTVIYFQSYSPMFVVVLFLPTALPFSLFVRSLFASYGSAIIPFSI